MNLERDSVMNEKIKQFKLQAGIQDNPDQEGLDLYAELIVASLADELLGVAKGSKKFNPEWANGVDHAAMLAQRMLMDLPEEE